MEELTELRPAVLAFFVCAAVTMNSCAVTLAAQRRSLPGSYVENSRYHTVENTAARSTLDLRAAGAGFEVRIVRQFEQTRYENIVYEGRRRIVSALRDEKGMVHLREWGIHQLFSEDRFGREINPEISISTYFLSNLAFLVPSLGISLVVTIADLVSLPFRLLDLHPEFETETGTQRNVQDSRQVREPVREGRFLCGTASFELHDSEARLTFQDLFQAAGGLPYADCSLAETDSFDPRNVRVWFSEYADNPAVGKYLEANQTPTLLTLAAVLTQSVHTGSISEETRHEISSLARSIRARGPAADRIRRGCEGIAASQENPAGLAASLLIDIEILLERSGGSP